MLSPSARGLQATGLLHGGATRRADKGRRRSHPLCHPWSPRSSSSDQDPTALRLVWVRASRKQGCCALPRTPLLKKPGLRAPSPGLAHDLRPEEDRGRGRSSKPGFCLRAPRRSRAESSRAEPSRARRSRVDKSRAERGGGERSGAERSRAPWSPAKASRAQPREAERQESSAAGGRTKGAGVAAGAGRWGPERRRGKTVGVGGGGWGWGEWRWGRSQQSWSHGSLASVTLRNWGAGGRRSLWNLVFPILTTYS